MDFQYTQSLESSDISTNNTDLRLEPATPSTINVNNADTIQKPAERSVSQSCDSDLSSCINSLYDSESAPSQSCDQNSSQTANNSEFVFVKPNPVQQNTNVNIVNNMQSDETSVKVLQCDATNPNIHQTKDSGPIRGRSQTSRSNARSRKRSQSSTPYSRKANSKSREDSPRVLPSAKNRSVSVESGFSPTTDQLTNDNKCST
ncbi:hypothetical protein ACF0H5_011301 [Mactra antiquata]